MRSKRLHSLATIFLTALYGVVGLTGGSLYYLTASVPGDLIDSPGDETVVYFHTHGSGDEGHFHRHTVHHRHLSVATIDVRHQTRQKKRNVAITSEVNAHQPHSCAILTLVSTLKLGNVALSSNSIILDSLVSPICESECIGALDVVRYSYARGPPSGSFA